jgi:hypothetical protein
MSISRFCPGGSTCGGISFSIASSSFAKIHTGTSKIM